MKQPRKYQIYAKKYQTLARGYAALRSKLAEPAKGAARAYEQMADGPEPGLTPETPSQASTPNRPVSPR